jgi:autotransporter-associated beta strand protein
MNKRRVCMIAMLAIASLLPVATIYAKTTAWQGPTGDPPDSNWSTAANWSLGVPVAGDTTNINNSQTATLDVAGATRYLYLGSAAGSGGLNIGKDLAIGASGSAGKIITGYAGTATSTVTQTAGTVTVASGGQFYVGTNTGTYPLSSTLNGVYNLQGGAVNVVGGTCAIGARSSGQVYQTGGEFKVAATTYDLTIGGSDYGASGLYDISAGTLTSLNAIYICYRETGALRVSGTATVNAGTFFIAPEVGTIAHGPYTAKLTQEGGVVNADHIVTYSVAGNNTTSTISLSGGLLNLTGTAASTIGTLHLLPGTSGLGGTIASVSSTLTSNANYDAQAGIVNAILAGGVGLSKTGPGTVTLGMANTYTGDTLVNDGILKLTGSVTSNVSVAGGATLMGGGTVMGNVASVMGGKVAPGASIGMMTVTGNATLSGTLDVEYNSGDDTIDMLSVSGALDLGGGVLKFADLATTPVALDQPAYVFASYGSLAAGRPTVEDLPDMYTVDYEYGEANNQIALVAIPEPSMIVLLVVGGLAAAAFRRRG